MDSNPSHVPFMNTWNGQWYAEMRTRLLTGDPPEACRNCNDTTVKDVNRASSHFVREYLPAGVAD